MSTRRSPDCRICGCVTTEELLTTPGGTSFLPAGQTTKDGRRLYIVSQQRRPLTNIDKKL